MTEIIPPRCSTLSGDPWDPCERAATHMLVYSQLENEKRQEYAEAVCKPCGEGYLRRPALKARLVPLGPETYAQREIVGGVPLPDGSKVVLGFHEGFTDPYVVARIGGAFTGNGKYLGTHERALALLVEELAQVVGLVIQAPKVAEPKGKPFTPPTYAEVQEFVDLATGGGNFVGEEN
jgi:hypothetical protein